MIPEQRANHGKLHVHQPERHVAPETESIRAERLQRPEDGALTDLAYILSGTYFTHGLQDAADALFAEVHRSNMSKLDENGRPIYREDGKVLKSARFSEPDLRVICTEVTTNG